MDPKKIVNRAITFDHPPRVPINYHNRDFEYSDTVAATWVPPPDFQCVDPGMTEWGYVWQSLDGTMGQPLNPPLLDWSLIEHYVPPEPTAAGRLDHLAEWIAMHRHKFLKFQLGITGFNQATFLRGFDEFLTDLCWHQERVERVLDLVCGFENGLIEQVSDLPFDAVVFGDDWGTQEGLIISPDQWRAIFKPRYAEQFSLVHESGKKVWFHTCGNVYAIIGDLIEIGVEVLELLQPDLFGVERLAADFGGCVCFACSVDHQRRALSGSREEIIAYVRRLRDNLGQFGGGFIAYIEDYACLGMSEQTYQWIREAFHELNDDWPPSPK